MVAQEMYLKAFDMDMTCFRYSLYLTFPNIFIANRDATYYCTLLYLQATSEGTFVKFGVLFVWGFFWFFLFCFK